MWGDLFLHMVKKIRIEKLPHTLKIISQNKGNAEREGETRLQTQRFKRSKLSKIHV